jgi:hypothetical protein
MSFLQQLQSVKKLKHVEQHTNSSKPDIILCKDSSDYRRMMEESFLENYFENIAQHSFKTLFLNLSIVQAKQLIIIHETFINNNNNNNDIDNDIKENIELCRLAKQIDDCIDRLSCENVFVRLSSRSAKDAPLLLKNFKSTISEFYDQLLMDNNNDDDRETKKNLQLYAIQAASIAACAVKTGFEAIQLLSRSKRIQDDLKSFVNGELTIESNQPFKIVTVCISIVIFFKFNI